MKYLVKTNDIGTLTNADYNRIVYDSTTGFVYCKGAKTFEYVDLGLPSHLKWAKCNVGANSEEESGLFFQWGDTQGYTAEQVGNGEGLKAFDWADYKFSIGGSDSRFSKYNDSDRKKILDLEDDAAHVNMVGNWRMPTLDEYKELCKNTDIFLVTTEGKEIKGTVLQDGMIRWAYKTEETLKGIKFYKQSDKQTYMFIPAVGGASEGSMPIVGKSGPLWTSSLGPSSIGGAWDFSFSASSGDFFSVYRCGGKPVRGVLPQ